MERGTRTQDRAGHERGGGTVGDRRGLERNPDGPKPQYENQAFNTQTQERIGHKARRDRTGQANLMKTNPNPTSNPLHSSIFFVYCSPAGARRALDSTRERGAEES